ncbi:MAG: ATP-binding protein [Candidatus Aminicenantes bacterium]|nr:ATP-binding protein [Candidatus Aminicenantes bacterium]
MVEKLYELSHYYLKNYNKEYKRYFLKKHPLKSRFYIVIGQRGVGKTTALIQHMLDVLNRKTHTRAALYVPVDHTLVARYSLYEIAETFYKEEGVKLIFFDEIHKYSEWARDLKSIYDVFTDLYILASGSSALEIYKSSHDLSRRAIVYRMNGMSFREFLEMTLNLSMGAYTLEEIVTGHERISFQIIDKITNKGKRILPLFKDYLKFGYYPYFMEHRDLLEEFYIKLMQDVRKTVVEDSLNVHPNLNGASVNKILKLLSLLTESVPYTPDLNDLKRKLEIGDIRTLKQYLRFLDDGNVISSITKKGRGFRELEKPDKIYLNNTNLIYALGEEKRVDKGNIRETFFANILSSFYEIKTIDRGDFFVDNKYTFEVGGKNKGFSQISGVMNSFLALDDIETGFKQKIPLWLFGFLY